MEHKCKYYRGKIRDVTYTRDYIRCRKCGARLTEGEVEEQTWAMVKSKMDKWK